MSKFLQAPQCCVLMLPLACAVAWSMTHGDVAFGALEVYGFIAFFFVAVAVGLASRSWGVAALMFCIWAALVAVWFLHHFPHSFMV